MELLTSIAIILLSALILGETCKKLKLPPLLGYLLIGIALSPYALNLIAGTIMEQSADLRQLALVVILTRAGLGLNINDLKKKGLNAVALCFLPALFEIGGYIVLGTRILGLDIIQAALLGCVMAAVSPAVIVPRMLKIKNENYSRKSGVSELIMAGAAVDDVIVIILFTCLLVTSSQGQFSGHIFWQTPLAIILGIIIGLFVGFLLGLLFRRYKTNEIIKALIVLCISLLFLYLEQIIGETIPYSALLSIITIGIAIFKFDQQTGKQLAACYKQMWIGAEIILFVLVGSAVDVQLAISSFSKVIVIIIVAVT